MQIYLSAGITLLFLTGSWLVITSLVPNPGPAARKAVRARAGQRDSLHQMVVDRMAVRLLPLIRVDPVNRERLRQDLQTMGYTGTPELFHARAWGEGILWALLSLIPVPLFRGLIVLSVALLFLGRQRQFRKLELRRKAWQQAIEWELPQFAGTIHQSLGHTRNVIEILESYRKICGPALQGEMDRTLNDMRTGTQEQAVRSLAARVNSAPFTQLTQGLVGILQGDDQRGYFQLLSREYNKIQQDLLRRELLKRPGKLTPNNVLMLVGMGVMLIVAIGGHLLDAGADFF